MWNERVKKWNGCVKNWNQVIREDLKWEIPRLKRLLNKQIMLYGYVSYIDNNWVP
jgi:hypothetical protein